MWNDLWAAIALVLVIEGLFPFLNPAGLRRTLQAMAGMDDGALRTAGLVSMIAGVALLFFVKN